MLTVPRNISFVGKAEYMDSWKTKYLFPAMGMIPIDRSGGEKSTAALDAAEGVLAPRRIVRHLPRGHAQPDRHLVQGAHRGGPTGDEDRLSDLPGRRHRHRQDPTARREGTEVVHRLSRSRSADRSGPSDTSNRGAEHIAWRSMIDEVMYEIRELTGQTYVNTLRR